MLSSLDLIMALPVCVKCLCVSVLGISLWSVHKPYLHVLNSWWCAGLGQCMHDGENVCMPSWSDWTAGHGPSTLKHPVALSSSRQVELPHLFSPVSSGHCAAKEPNSKETKCNQEMGKEVYFFYKTKLCHKFLQPVFMLIRCPESPCWRLWRSFFW